MDFAWPGFPVFQAHRDGHENFATIVTVNMTYLNFKLMQSFQHLISKMIFAIFLISLTVSAENLKCSECHSIVFSSNQIDGDGAKCFEGSPERESESKHIKPFLK